jgi:1-deoxy-D-xylulose-5-phosphate reductoisomerase
MKKRIGILGSTGSIGVQTLEVIDLHDEFEVVALTANTNVDRLYEQCLKYKPQIVALMDRNSQQQLSERLQQHMDLKIDVLWGMEGLIAVAKYAFIDTLVTAVVGMIGLVPTIEAIKANKTIALANKETLVTAGELIMPLAKAHSVKILPVDSEHSAIYQSLQGNAYKKIEKVILTASGGPFRGKDATYLKNVSLEEALKHPNWEMGAKITIDSSTLMNKGLEVIEAKWLFDVEPDQIEVVVHPESIIHSMVQYIDGSVIAQLGLPDMRLPIQYALFETQREFMPYERLDLTKLRKLTFEKPDIDTFKCLKLAFTALEYGGLIPTILNAANEVIVAMFLDKKIQYFQIADYIEEVMNTYLEEYYDSTVALTLDHILEAQAWAEQYIERRWHQ